MDKHGSIVELTLNDLEKCKSFWKIPSDMMSYRLARYMHDSERKAFAYKIDENFVGGCALHIREEGCGHLSFFSVAPKFRNNGIGSKLLDFTMEYFKDLGMEKVRLHVYKNNTKAIRLYERKGFIYAFDVTPDKIAMIKII